MVLAPATAKSQKWKAGVPFRNVALGGWPQPVGPMAGFPIGKQTRRSVGNRERPAVAEQGMNFLFVDHVVPMFVGILSNRRDLASFRVCQTMSLSFLYDFHLPTPVLSLSASEFNSPLSLSLPSLVVSIRISFSFFLSFHSCTQRDLETPGTCLTCSSIPGGRGPHPKRWQVPGAL